MADISKLEEQADLLMANVSGWENSHEYPHRHRPTPTKPLKTY